MIATATRPIATSPREATLWARYFRTRSVTDRNALVEHYDRLAWAAMHRANLPAHVSNDDISGLVMETLIWCVERYDGERGARFTGWATQRLAGAIKDYLRNWGRPDGWHRQRGRLAHVASLDAAAFNDDQGEHRHDVFTDDTAGAAIVHIDAADTVEAVANLLRSSSPNTTARTARQQAAIVRLRYIHAMTMRQIGEAMSISESRICQIHGQAMQRLQGELREQVVGLVA